MYRVVPCVTKKVLSNLVLQRPISAKRVILLSYYTTVQVYK